LCFLMAMFFVSSGTLAADEEGYSINIDRQEKVGNKNHVVYCTTIKTDTIAMVDGKKCKESKEAVAVNIDGTLTVVALASNGQPSRVHIRVDRCEVTANNKPLLIAKKGDQLVATKQMGVWESNVRLNDAEVDKTAAGLIGSILALHEPNKTQRDGGVYGLDVKRHIGERWNINSKAFANYMKKYDPNAKEGDFSGTGEFIGITKTNGAEWANIRMDMTCCSKPSPEGSPWRITECETRTAMSFAVPLGDKPLKISGETCQTRKMAMESDSDKDGALRHLTWKEASQCISSFDITALDAEKAGAEGKTEHKNRPEATAR
jgi:hypothetical protein